MTKKRGGYALVMAIMILTVLGILIPAIIKLVQKESKDTVNSNKKTVALQLAEAGQDRGAWKLRESDTIWNNAVAGTALTDYNDDRVYTDVAGGQYKIQITTGPTPGTVAIISKGKATDTNDVRAIKAVYTKGAVIGAVSVNGALQYKPNLKVEWGPVVTFTSITQSPANNYPRKFSAGQIIGRDTTNDSMNGALPAGNWNDYDYAAFYDLGAVPQVDLAYYLTKAKNTLAPVLKKGTGSGNASPWTGGGFNSGYYPSSTNANGVKIEKGTGAGDYSFSCSTCVIYIEGEVKRYPNGAWLDLEGLVVTSDLDFNAGGHTYTVNIPNTASEEYQYDPDGLNYWASKGWTDGASVTLSDVGFHGFMYVGGDVENAGGGSTLVGAIFVNGSITTNTTTVYYDQSVTNNIKLSNATVSRSSWDEIRVSW